MEKQHVTTMGFGDFSPNQTLSLDEPPQTPSSPSADQTSTDSANRNPIDPIPGEPVTPTNRLIRPSFKACWPEWLSGGFVALVLLVMTPMIADVIIETGSLIGFEGSKRDALVAAIKTTSVAAALVLIFAFGRIGHIWLDTRIKLCPTYIELRRGIIASKRSKIDLRHIRSVETEQGVIDRLLGTGTIELGSAGTSEMEIKVTRLNDPVGVRDRIKRAIAEKAS